MVREQRLMNERRGSGVRVEAPWKQEKRPGDGMGQMEMDVVRGDVRVKRWWWWWE